jgi:hypothetical protein
VYNCDKDLQTLLPFDDHMMQDSENLACNLHIFPLISTTDIEKYRSVWRQTYYDITDKNNKVSFEALGIQYN